MDNRKTQIVELAFNLIQEKGYVAFSYDDLAKPLGVTKASIHYHFEKKEDLGLTIADRMLQALEQFPVRFASHTAQERLNKFIEERIERFGDHEICPLSSLQTDYESLPQELQKKVQLVSQKEIAVLADILTDMKSEGLLESSSDTNSLAYLILSCGKGILQYQRVLGISVFPQLFKEMSRLIF
ncbi:TetR/AcrR family transcriptional regulator [Paenibacillus sepulcri]|uniref:TetR/AcrR family transcriptional regulator n=1 Tax=Paenibacillus sepulcri TaxID=359917 RepID=A0ABS7BWS6_9BACL|nr:TetR/AcrR family transcriptional regulator [Paenibacillus sepulcri]